MLLRREERKAALAELERQERPLKTEVIFAPRGGHVLHSSPRRPKFVRFSNEQCRCHHFTQSTRHIVYFVAFSFIIHSTNVMAVG